MVSIRLSRGGAKKRPFYHIVVTDQRNRRDGRYIERLGFFNPVARGGEQKLQVDVARVEYWVGHGAQPSDRVAALLETYRKAPPAVESEAEAEKPAPKEVKAVKSEPKVDSVEADSEATGAEEADVPESESSKPAAKKTATKKETTTKKAAAKKATAKKDEAKQDEPKKAESKEADASDD